MLVFRSRPVNWILVLVSLTLISGVAAGQMSFHSSSVGFGNVQLGSSVIVPIAVTNTGTVSLTIWQAAVSGTGFAFAGPQLPMVLAPQQKANLSVIFAPHSAGNDTGSMMVYAEIPWSPHSGRRWIEATVVLSGNGVSAPTPGYLTVPSTLNLGTVSVVTSQSQTLALTNSSGYTVTISPATPSGSGFRVSGLTFPYSLAAGKSVNLAVTFSPAAAGADSATLAISSNASDSYVAVALAGSGANPVTPGTLTITPASISFGSVNLGASQTQSLTLANSGGSSLTISAATLSGSGYSVSGPAFPYSLAAGKTANLSVTFAPTATGSDNAALGLSSNASDPSLAVSFSGTGASPATTGTLTVTPASISFGSVNVNSSQTQNGSISASGGSVTVSSVTSSNAQFTLGGLMLPVTIAAGQSVPFNLTFTPAAPGASSATISFLGGSTSSTKEAASGTGATIQHTVSLSWNPSTSTSISGYNVYRASAAAGPYAKLNPSLNASLYFSDSSVQSGQP